jgi:hypothetical protein
LKIVETNIIYEGLTFHDHQTRVLEISSWEEYCDLYRNYDGTPVGDKYKCVYNEMQGYVLPKNATILGLHIDDFHLTCDLNLWNEAPHYKLAYIIEQ